jgi:hypothetical protein
VVAGDGVFVEGSGSVNNPFKISVDASLSSGGGGFIPAFENAQPGSAFVILEPEDGWGVSPRPTSRDDLFFFFKGPTTPPVVSTGRNGMRDGIDTYLSTA